LFQAAVRNGQTETVKILFQLGACLDCQDENGKTPLYLSVETGKLDVIKCIDECQETIQREMELENVTNPEGIVRKGNCINVPNIDGNTPLHLGVAVGNTNIVSYFISTGSDKNTCNIRGKYPLTLAARCGKNDIVELSMGGEMQYEEAQIGALRAAIVAGHVDTTDLLLSLGAPVNKGEDEKPILFFYSSVHHSYICRYLTRCNNAQYMLFISLQNHSTCFGCLLHPSSGVQEL
jgi:hypothetical protein